MTTKKKYSELLHYHNKRIHKIYKQQEQEKKNERTIWRFQIYAYW